MLGQRLNLGGDKLGTLDFTKTIGGNGVTCLADIEDASLCEQPLGLNHPAWLLLHVATDADYAASLLGGSGVCPADWNAKADTKKAADAKSPGLLRTGGWLRLHRLEHRAPVEAG